MKFSREDEQENGEAFEVKQEWQMSDSSKPVKTVRFLLGSQIACGTNAIQEA